jgi:hypothetical protein
MASSPLLTDFFLDKLPLPWGTTLAEADARLANYLQRPPYGGWPNLRLACTWALGLAATSCHLRAPARARPVLQASYELAAPPHYRLTRYRADIGAAWPRARLRATRHWHVAPHRCAGATSAASLSQCASPPARCVSRREDCDDW